MNVEVDGFVLSEIPYGETSKIINVFTKEYGVIGIMCKGAKQLKNKNRVPTMKLNYTRFNIMYNLLPLVVPTCDFATSTILLFPI